MSSDEQQEILRQIAELRRESRVRHRWVIFISVCVGLPLFGPHVAAFIASASAHLAEFAGAYLAPFIALLILIIGAAAIISRSTPRADQMKEVEPRDR